jgi:hypothetical protein
MMKVLNKHCKAVMDAQETGDEAAVKDAELQVVITAMMLCGYKWGEEGRYIKTEE